MSPVSAPRDATEHPAGVDGEPQGEPVGRVDIVVPTIGRPSLGRLLDSLAASVGPLPGSVVLVDDRPPGSGPLLQRVPERLRDRLRVVEGAAAGPAAARNRGWRTAAAEWVAFLDDDVEVGPCWLQQLDDDLRGAEADADTGGVIGGVQGRIRVPKPAQRPPTDWERNVAGLEQAVWATADLAYRRAALTAVGGFDERFSRAYREDADLGLRVTERGWRITLGAREVTHPVRPADRWVSLRLQAGNADDALLRVLHGPDWRRRARIGAGRRPRHALATVAAAVAAVATALGRRRVGAAAAAVWATETALFAWARIRPGPRSSAEVATMVLTSVAIPPLAIWHWLRGRQRAVALVRPPPTGVPEVADRRA